MPEIYKPAEDSYLMSEVLEKEVPKLLKSNANLKVLEVGVGSGIQLDTLSSSGIKKENILGIDINKEAVTHCINKEFNCILSDLFQEVKEKFDLIIFNPPYLPKDKREPESSALTTSGGNKGNELTVNFLRDAKDYLNMHGKIFLITSSLSPNFNFDKLGYNAGELSFKKLFFEKISVWELKPINSNQ